MIITEAQPSQTDQHAARKRRYTITMAMRIVALILAAVFYKVVWLMIIFVILGTVLPWVAVLMANDRPPKKKTDMRGYTPPPDRVLDNPSRSSRIIDV